MSYLKIAATFGPALLCLILGALLWGAHAKIEERDLKIAALEEQVEFTTSTVSTYVRAVSTRDDVIRQQNASMEALKAAAAADRAEYDTRLATARAEATTHRGRAAELLALATPEGELAQCRAARDLLESELIHDE
jgi:ribosomal protein L12E/L44/L45/RPP1/RPP2